MEIYGLCMGHKSKFQPMCHDMGSACYGCFRHSRRVCRLYLRLLKFYDTTKSQVCSIVIKMEDCINAEDIDC